jgi:hypothetical protein
MAFFHRVQLADGRIAFQEFDFSSALSSAQRLRSRLETTNHIRVGGDNAFPAHRWPFGLGGNGVMPAQNVGDKSGGAVFTADIGISRRGCAGEPETREIFFVFTELLTQVASRFLKSAITAGHDLLR